MATNVVSAVRLLATQALKSGHALNGVVQPPSKWASAAGFNGSAAGPLRQHMARDSGNGCGRQSRYPAVNAEGMIELLDLADRYHAEKAEAKRSALAKRINGKLRPTQTRQAKGRARKAATPAKAPRKAKAAA